jgi:hypothetical protein
MRHDGRRAAGTAALTIAPVAAGNQAGAPYAAACAASGRSAVGHAAERIGGSGRYRQYSLHCVKRTGAVLPDGGCSCSREARSVS